MLVPLCDICKKIVGEGEVLFHIRATRIENLDMTEYPKLDAHLACMPLAFLMMLNGVSGHRMTRDVLGGGIEGGIAEAPTATQRELRRLR